MWQKPSPLLSQPRRIWRRVSRPWRRVFAERRGYRFAAQLPEPAARPAVEPNPSPLEEFFDANTSGPGIWKWRHYFEIYHRHLAKFRGREVHIVEIGIYSGGSLRMWHDYFGPQCRVYGVDIEPACKAYETDGSRVYIGDQASPEFWADFIKKVPRIDVVIDDGGHETRQQLATLEGLLPHLSPGGVYLCEDINGIDSMFQNYVAGLARNLHRTVGGVSRTWGVPEWAPASSLQQLVSSVHLYPGVAVLELRATEIDGFTSERHGTEWQPFAP